MVTLEELDQKVIELKAEQDKIIILLKKHRFIFEMKEDVESAMVNKEKEI